jgi:molybdenum cofactor guanylyltransferase
MSNRPLESVAPSSCREGGERVGDAAGFVLAGGQSSRMGRDKALLSFAGRPLIAHAVSILRQAGLPVSIAGSRSPALAEFAPVIEDSEPGLGPLAGICAALQSTPAHVAVFVPVDVPLLPASLIVHLLHHARITGRAVTLPAVNGFAETFPVVLDRAILPSLKAELEAGRNGCFSAFQTAASALSQPVSTVAVELLAQSGHVNHPLGLAPFCWFLNLNNAADLARAEALGTRRIA